MQDIPLLDYDHHISLPVAVAEVLGLACWVRVPQVRYLDSLGYSRQQAYLAYAAFHCSSRRALAVSRSVWETKREPTEPVEMEGIASSAMSMLYRTTSEINKRQYGILCLACVLRRGVCDGQE